MRHLLLSLLLLASSALAQTPPGSDLWRELFQPPYTSPTELSRESALRKDLFDLLRPRVEKQAGRSPIKFQGELKAYKNWAFFNGLTLDANGKGIRFGEMGNSETCALWLRTRDGWKVVDYATGFGDVFWEIWIEQYGAPAKLLGF